MGAYRLLKYWKHVMIAASVVALVYFMNVYQLRRSQHDYALVWARQTAAQAEGLMMLGKSLRKKNPLMWAVAHLAQSEKARNMQINTVKANLVSKSRELYQINDNGTEFDYVRVFSPHSGKGIRIRVAIPFQGFLGTQSKFGNDFLMVVVFFLMFTLLAMIEKKVPHFVRRGEAEIRRDVRQWAKNARETILELAKTVKELLEDVADLAYVTTNSHNNMGQLAKSIESQFSDLQDLKSKFAELENTKKVMEIEIRRIQEKTKAMGSQGDEVHTLSDDVDVSVQNMTKIFKSVEELIHLSEAQIRRIVEQFEATTDSFKEALESRGVISDHVKRGNEVLANSIKEILKVDRKYNPTEKKIS